MQSGFKLYADLVSKYPMFWNSRAVANLKDKQSQMANQFCPVDKATQNKLRIILENPEPWLNAILLKDEIKKMVSNFYGELSSMGLQALSQNVGFGNFDREINVGLDEVCFSYHTYGPASSRCWRIKESYLPGYFSFDPTGFSGWSWIARNTSIVEGYLDAIDLAVAKEFTDQLKADLKLKNASKYPQPEKKDQLPQEKFVFLPLQTVNDIVISLAIDDYFQIILEAVKATKLLKKNLVIKRHPLCSDFRVTNLLKQLSSEEHVTITESSIHNIFPNTEAVVVINSGVGFEALINGLPVITLGSSDYQIATKRLNKLSDLIEALQNIDRWHSPEKIQKFIFFYTNVYLFRCDDIERIRVLIAMALWSSEGASGDVQDTPNYMYGLLRSRELASIKKLEDTNKKLNEVLQSTSWWVTAPLRALARFLKKIIAKLKQTMHKAAFPLKAAIQGIIKDIFEIYLSRMSAKLKCSSIRPDRLPKKIVIAGGYGYSNIGDEAQLSHSIHKIRNIFPDAQITILTPNKTVTRTFHNGLSTMDASRVIFFNSDSNPHYGASDDYFKRRYLWFTPYILSLCLLYRLGLRSLMPKKYQPLVATLYDTDLMYFSGGGYLTSATLSRLWDSVLVMRIANLFNKPTLLSGQQIEPIVGPLCNQLTKWGLMGVTGITLRDRDKSARVLGALGVAPSLYSETNDDALFYNTDVSSGDNLLYKETFYSGSFVAVNFHLWGQTLEKSNNFAREMASACDTLQGSGKYQLVFVPMVPSDIEGYNLLKSFMKTPLYLFEPRDSIDRVVCAFRQAKFTITFKHHPIIFSVGGYKPVISIVQDDYYFHKNKGALDLFGLGEFIIDTQKIDGSIAEAILKNIATIETNYEAIQNKIRYSVESLRGADDKLLREYRQQCLNELKA